MKIRIRIRILCLFFLFTYPAFCFGANSIPLGDTDLTPSLGVLYFSDDNVFQQNSDQTDDTGLLYTPRLEWTADKGLNSVTLIYNGEFARHDETDYADYDDHDIAVQGEMEFSSRSRLSLVGRTFAGHEAPNIGRSQELADKSGDLTEYNDTGATINYQYGAKTAKGNMEFGLEYANRDYSNNEQVTDGYSFNRFSPSFTFLYAISSATRISSGIEYSVFDYERADSIVESDNTSWFLFTGARWDITGKSGGDLKIGYGQQDFDAAAKDDQSSMLVRFGGYWNPLEHSRINTSIQRNFGVDTDSPSVNTQFALDWSHEWSSFVSSRASYQWLDSDSDNADSEYTRNTLALDMAFKIRRWIELSLLAKSSSTTSPDADKEFDKVWVGGGFKLTL